MAETIPSTNISFTTLRTIMGGGTGTISLSAYQQRASGFLTSGIPGVPLTGAINVNAFSSKSRALMPGLQYRLYSGYFNDDPTWFAAQASWSSSGVTTNFDTSGNAFGLVANAGWTLTSVEWYGYFYATTTGTWTFYTFSDDASYLWIGNVAQSGFTTANCTVNNGGLHGGQERSGTVSLTADTWYPIRIQFGQNGGGAEMRAYFAPPGGSAITNWTGYGYSGLGSYSSYPVINALTLKALTSTNRNGSYFVIVNGISTATFCLMDSKWDNGGWMMVMKATRGTTFNYDSTYWTAVNNLNATDTTRNDADAKFDAFNYMPVKDIMALWPDVTQTGGSISQTENWSWLTNNFFNSGARTTMITGLSSANSRDSPTGADPTTWSGFSSAIWSAQGGFKRHVLGGVTHTSSPYSTARWGFIWNNETDMNSPDAAGGIGMKHTWGVNITYSAGDYYGCCGSQGYNRTMRFELYAR